MKPINNDWDETNNMEMPCLCDCGKWFDLNDGKRSLFNENRIICKDCYREEVAQEEENANY